MFNSLQAQEIWHESFSIPGKGIHGSNEGNLQSDFNGIDSWTLEFSNLDLTDSGDYAGTVATSGGRFEVCDIDGEVVWRSVWIDITGFENVGVELVSAETGSGANTGTKYMKVFYRIDEGPETLFNENGINTGNWGSVKVKQVDLKGARLQIVCYISSHYASDKVILDEITVWAEQDSLPPVGQFDVVINELMIDPFPKVELPEVEYIELFNRRDFSVNIVNWELRINGVSKKLQNILINPADYLLICATGSFDSLLIFGNVAGLPGFQGLLNREALIELMDSEGNVIDRIEYSETWYQDIGKSNGGWSLERIDPDRHCNQPGNWKASMDPAGGTPGKENSVHTENKDNVLPNLKWAVAVSETQVELVFSEPVDTVMMNGTGNYEIPGLGNPVMLEMISSEHVVAHFNQSLVKDKLYMLHVENLTDECGNPLHLNQFQIQWNLIEPGDIVINEILFDPYPGGEDFVEIYNRSEKLVDLSRLYIANRSRELKLDQIFPLSFTRRILYPEEYLVLTADTNGIYPWYFIKYPQCFLQIERLPSFSNTEGHVVLLNYEIEVIDELYYEDKMHTSFLADAEGVSLERVSFYDHTNAPGNWHSASGQAGYATPGYENSQSGTEQHGKPAVKFEHESFSPNYDGYNDECIISYRTNKPGYVANISVFDASGRFVQHILKNELLGTSGEIVWNGEDETGQRHPLGIYIVMVELFNAEGEVCRFKEGVVITDILD